jgi:SOS-response transcriptional repressor LexA
MKKKILKDFYRKDQQVALKSKSGTYDPIVLDKKMTNILRNCLRFKKRKEKKKES